MARVRDFSERMLWLASALFLALALLIVCGCSGPTLISGSKVESKADVVNKSAPRQNNSECVIIDYSEGARP